MTYTGSGVSLGEAFGDTLYHALVHQRVATREEANAIKAAVVGYADDPQACCSGFFYRLWNAVKAIFGQSDWQVAKRALKSIAENAWNAATQQAGVVGDLVSGVLQGIRANPQTNAQVQSVINQMTTQCLETLVQISSGLNMGQELYDQHQAIVDQVQGGTFDLSDMLKLNINVTNAGIGLGNTLQRIFG